ncbi:MAG TPA: SurA N-terminal domain-containing protein [Terriglobales bacterium]|nr:SurA N-terminal domain-containing protein [Terriglobales bacterium]
MLGILRKKKRSWIITILLGLIIIVFIAFYGGIKPNGNGGEDIAEVNGEIISQTEFALAYQRALDRYRELFKGSLTPELLKSLNLKGALLEELIETRLALQEAHRLGLTATDDELMSSITRIPEFQANGRFNKARYIQLLRANRLTPAQFEEQQRNQLTIQRLYGVLLDGVNVTETEVRNRYRSDQEKIDLYFVRYPAKNFLSQVKVTEEEVKNFYQRNQESLKEPLKVKAEYLSFPFDRFGTSARISDKEIEAYYQANRQTKFHSPKEVKLRYILIRFPPGTNNQQKEAAQARANRVFAEARASKNFAALAKKESDDPSAANGGEIGWLAQGQMPPGLDQAVFALGKGAISSPIETPAGFAIMKIEDVKEEKTQSLEEATAEIRGILKTENGKREAVKVADQDREKAQSGVSLEKLAKESDIPVRVTPWLIKGEVLPEIGPVDEFYRNALVLRPNELSPVIEGTHAYYLLKVKERKEPTVPPLDSVRTKLEKELRDSKAFEIALNRAKSSLEQLKKQPDISKLALPAGVKLEETGSFVRSAPQIPKVGEVNGLPAGGLALSAQKPIPDKVFTHNDEAILFAFKDSQEPDMKGFQKEKENLMKQALAESRQRVLERFKDELKANANIEIHAGALETI